VNGTFAGPAATAATVGEIIRHIPSNSPGCLPEAAFDFPPRQRLRHRSKPEDAAPKTQCERSRDASSQAPLGVAPVSGEAPVISAVSRCDAFQSRTISGPRNGRRSLISLYERVVKPYRVVPDMPNVVRSGRERFPHRQPSRSAVTTRFAADASG